MKQEKMIVYFSNEDELKLYHKLREMAFQKKIKSVTGFLKSCAYDKLHKKGLIK
jgi:hypothetical protein